MLDADFILFYIINMWKSIGSVKSGDDVSVRSNRSRCDINIEPFHHGLKRKSNVSPDAHRSFCYQYFENRRNKTLNDSIASNKSQKNIIIGSSNQDIFTELRNKTREDQGSKLTDKVRQNPQAQKRARKNYQQVKKASSRIHTLKKEQLKLKSTMENEFNAFKNLFYQLEEHIHQHQNDVPVQKQTSTGVEQSFLRDLLSEAVGLERYFQQMDRKKAALMQRLTQ